MNRKDDTRNKRVLKEDGILVISTPDKKYTPMKAEKSMSSMLKSSIEMNLKSY